jgi:GDP-L-fucose synthase
MKALVTGATGFLGTHLCRALARRGDEVVAVGSATADLRNPASLDRLAGPFDRVYHLAAWTQAGDFCLSHPGEQWVINQQINTTVLAWWQRRQPQATLVSIGTSCAYDPAQAATEDRYLVGEPTESLYTYAMTKRMLQVGVESLARQFGRTYLTAVPSTLYGPGYHTDGRQMHFIFDLMRKIIRGKEHGEPVVLWGDGYQTREVVFIDDFIRALLALADQERNTIVNVGSGDTFTIREFASRISRIVGYDESTIQYDPARYVGAKAKHLDPARMNRLLPGFRFTPLDEGLASTISWMTLR